jgi:hypothetical protein
MSFAMLAVISLVAIVGPLLALPRRWHLRSSWGVGRRDRAGDDWQRRLQAHNETFTFLAAIGFVLIKSIRSRPVVCRAGWLVLATGAPAAARWRLGRPWALT